MISIHVLREEDDRKLYADPVALKKFQSTSSARRTTVLHWVCTRLALISIHVLREEDDGAHLQATRK